MKVETTVSVPMLTVRNFDEKIQYFHSNIFQLKLSKELSDLINYVQSVHFVGFQKAMSGMYIIFLFCFFIFDFKSNAYEHVEFG